MTYILIFIFLIYCAWDCDVHGHKKWAKVNFYILFVSFFLLAGLRYKIGGDTLNYMATWDLYPTICDDNWFDRLKQLRSNSALSKCQPGWLLYATLVRSINSSFITLQLVSSFLINIAIFRTVKKYSNYPFLTLLIYYMTFTFYQFEFELARECVAVALFLLLAFDNWVKKDWVPFYIGTAIAYMVHPGALVMFALPLVRNIDWSTKRYSLQLLLPALILGIAGKIFLGNLIASIVSSESVLSYNTRAINAAYNNNYLISSLFTPSIILIMMLSWRKYALSQFIPLIFVTAALMIMTLFDFDCVRFANYIIIPVYIAFSPMIAHFIRQKRTMWVGIMLMIVYSLPQAYVVYRGGELSWSRYFPYQTVIYPNQTPTQQRYWNR